MEKLHPPLLSQSGDALYVGTQDGVEFPVEPFTDKGASVCELGGVAFLIEELCATLYSATYNSYDTRRKSFTLVREREGGSAQTLVLEKMRDEARGIGERMARFVSWDCWDCGIDKIIQGIRVHSNAE